MGQWRMKEGREAAVVTFIGKATPGAPQRLQPVRGRYDPERRLAAAVLLRALQDLYLACRAAEMGAAAGADEQHLEALRGRIDDCLDFFAGDCWPAVLLDISADCLSERVFAIVADRVEVTRRADKPRDAGPAQPAAEGDFGCSWAATVETLVSQV